MSNPKVELHIAGYGVITLELDADKAPKAPKEAKKDETKPATAG